MLIFLILRTGLLLRSYSLVDHSFAALLKVYAVGSLLDGVTFFFVMLPVVIYLILVPDHVFRWRISRYLSLGVYFLFVFLVLFGGVADWLFWEEFGSQFNFLVVDYLVYTREMIGNAVESYPVTAIVSTLLLVAFLIVLFTKKRLLIAHDSSSTLGKRLSTGWVYLGIPLFSLLLAGESVSNVSPNHYNTELAKNCLYSVVASFFYNSIEYNSFYPTHRDALTFTYLRDLLKTGNSRYDSEDAHDITRTVVSHGEERRKNVVVVVVESLSAEYLGVFGNQGHLTPNLDALAGESLLFRNLYATGTRTDRGLEAIALSVPPTPGRSLVKRPHNENLFTAGQIFRNKGYDTRFIYGGFGYFDNMNAFFKGNGFQVTDRSDMAADEISFSNVWGVCDEDLFARVIKESDLSYRNKKPFFSIVLTTSNHRPFTYPQRIDVPSGSSREGAVKYTDYAIGRLVQVARSKPWFGDTVFVIVADHCAQSAGKVEVPVHKYHIPLIIHSPGFVHPGECRAIGSQIDIVPTVLELLNISYRSRFFGQDLLSYPPGRALMGTYQKLGLYNGDKLTLLEPEKRALTFKVGPNGFQEQTRLDAALLMDTIAYYQGASDLLKRGMLSAIPDIFPPMSPSTPATKVD